MTKVSHDMELALLSINRPAVYEKVAIKPLEKERHFRIIEWVMENLPYARNPEYNCNGGSLLIKAGIVIGHQRDRTRSSGKSAWRW